MAVALLSNHHATLFQASKFLESLIFFCLVVYLWAKGDFSIQQEPTCLKKRSPIECVDSLLFYGILDSNHYPERGNHY